MPVLNLPQWAIKEIDKIRRHFLWHGASEQHKGYNLANWTSVCQPKTIGGLGILDLRIFNYALLMKWHWDWYAPQNKALETAPFTNNTHNEGATKIQTIPSVAN